MFKTIKSHILKEILRQKATISKDQKICNMPHLNVNEPKFHQSKSESRLDDEMEVPQTCKICGIVFK